MSVFGVYARTDAASYRNTELGAALRPDAPSSVAGWARQVGRPLTEGRPWLPQPRDHTACRPAREALVPGPAPSTAGGDHVSDDNRLPRRTQRVRLQSEHQRR